MGTVLLFKLHAEQPLHIPIKMTKSSTAVSKLDDSVEYLLNYSYWNEKQS